jgi:ferredoxin
VNSIKEFLFPRHETLFSFSAVGRKVELTPVSVPPVEQIIVAARPCDAASLPILDHVFNWDDRDALYNRRRELTTVVTLACQDHDEHCFCTSVGLGPDNGRGSDAMLIPLADDQFEVRWVTDKGRRLLGALTVASELVGQVGPGPERKFRLDDLQSFLADGFDDPLWRTASLRCLGCGACAHQCPTCHCFDIVDQGTSRQGRRVRNWDSCQHSMYSKHASGHNPRDNQGDRQRNRVFHKYHTYPRKFGDLLCTGCGACGRNCPVGLGVLSMLREIQDTRSAVVEEVT